MALLGAVLGWPAFTDSILVLILISLGLLALGAAFFWDTRRKAVVTLHLTSGREVVFECRRAQMEAVVAGITRRMHGG